jgi:hypothetical protein
MHKYLTIYEDSVSHLCLYNQSLLIFLIFAENFIFYFISAAADEDAMAYSEVDRDRLYRRGKDGRWHKCNFRSSEIDRLL